jgi:GNAT superfamily N-acetyltransferase
MRPNIVVETLSAGDIPSNLALSRSVGWPDTEAEWQVIHEAALVLGVRREGRLVGQGALGLYQGAGSIAKMVSAPDAQRQGVGAAILERLLAEAERRALPVVGLVSTAFGRPLYEQHGFAPLGGVAILTGTPRLEAASQAAGPVRDAEQMLALEGRFIKSSRAVMLRGRLRESCASALCEGGFGLATAHDAGARLGPVIADTEQTAHRLTMSIFEAVAGPVRVDVPVEQRAFRDWLLGLGLVERGVNVEMSVGGAALPWRVPQRFALALQAWG